MALKRSDSQRDPMTRSTSLENSEENLEPDLFERLYCYNDGKDHADDYTPVVPKIPKSILIQSLRPFDEPTNAQIPNKPKPRLTWKFLLGLLVIAIICLLKILD
ncbi:hypothetical protein ACLKA6_010635 [Drosophila palustris]